MLALGQQMGGMPAMGEGPQLDLDRDVYMGHEFCAEVLEVGPDTVGPAPGTLVTSIPVLLTMTGVQPIVYSNDVAGGYGERMLLSAPMLARGAQRPRLPARRAHRADGGRAPRGEQERHHSPREGALVLGCGPVGLAVIGALKLKGVETIVATDFSPARRALATTMGATEVVDPAAEPAFDAWMRAGGGKSLVCFEAIGVPGIIDSVLRDAPHSTRLVVVGVCMETDRINPFFGISKELNVQFCLGYDPMEFTGTLRSIAEGELDVAPLITGEVDLDGVPGAFEALANPDEHCKILVTPT